MTETCWKQNSQKLSADFNTFGLTEYFEFLFSKSPESLNKYYNTGTT